MVVYPVLLKRRDGCGWPCSSSQFCGVRPVFELVWESLMRTLKSTGTIIWVTIGAAALAGAYTIAGGPQYVADLIVGRDMPTMGHC